MAFPDDPLVPEVLIYLGDDWGWWDVTQAEDVRQAVADSGGGITISRGESSEGRQADPGRCSLVLANPGGVYSPRNPRSSFYGLIGRNTPIVVRLPDVDAGSGLAVPGQTNANSAETGPVAYAVTTTGMSITNDLDVRFWGRHHNAWREPSLYTLCGRWTTTGDNRSWYLGVSAAGHVTLGWSSNGTLAARRVVVSTVPVVADPTGELAVRAVLDVNNGAGQYAVLFYTAPTMAGPWTQLGSTVVGSTGTTSVFNGNAGLEIGGEHQFSDPTFSGEVYGFQLRNGIGGPILADPDFTNLTPDQTQVSDSTGRVYQWQAGIHVIDRSARFCGEVSSWPVRWDRSDRDVWTPIEASGILRRLGQGVPPVQSPLRRTLTATNPAAYLPLEDGTETTRPASAAAGVRLGTARNTTFGQAATGGLAVAAVARFDDAGGYIATGVEQRSSSIWAGQFLFRLASLPPDGNYVVFARMHMTGGPVARWEFEANNVAYRFRGLSGDGSVVTSENPFFGDGAAPNQWIAMSLTVQQSGGNTNWQARWWSLGSSPFYIASASYSGGPGRPTQFELLGSNITAGAEWSHLLVVPAVAPMAGGGILTHATGYAGERAGLRMMRLCQEAGVPIVFAGHPYLTEQMGAQPIGTLLDLLRDCADTDGGIFGEARGLLGLSYRTRASLCNRQALPVSYAAGLISPPFEPTDDDDQVVNDVTVSRPGGSDARLELPSGPLSVQPPPAGVGRYAADFTVNVASDERLPEVAGWRLHLGTVDETRYPRIRLNLAGKAWRQNPALRRQLVLLDAGEHLSLEDLPQWLPPGPTRAMLRGYTETIDAYQWDVTVNASPGEPWLLGVAGGAPVESNGSVLASGVNASAPSWLVTVTGPVWTTNPAHFPLDMVVGGERVRVTAISGASSPQTFTVTRAINGVAKSHAAGASIRLYRPLRFSL